MKKALIGTASLALILVIGTTSVSALTGTKKDVKQLQTNRNGVCESCQVNKKNTSTGTNYVDKNNNGVCDHHENSENNHNCPNYVDENNDGVCDHHNENSGHGYYHHNNNNSSTTHHRGNGNHRNNH